MADAALLNASRPLGREYPPVLLWGRGFRWAFAADDVLPISQTWLR